MNPFFRQCFSRVRVPMEMQGALVLGEHPNLGDKEVQVIEIPPTVLEYLQWQAHRSGRSLWDEVLVRLSCNEDAPNGSKDLGRVSSRRGDPANCSLQ